MADCAIVFSTVIATAATVATAFILQSHGVPLLQRAERSQRAARVEQRAALLNQQAWGCKLFGARGDRVYWPQRGGGQGLAREARCICIRLHTRKCVSDRVEFAATRCLAIRRGER